MRLIACEQGSAEWLAARLGVPSASCFDCIITPKTMKPSASQVPYLARLVAEWFLGQPIDDKSTAFMDRGTELEPEAVAYYALVNDADVREVGFCVRDDMDAGCSPDRLVGDDGLLEIKCPGPAAQMAYILGGAASLAADHYCQVQGQLWVTGRAWVDLLAYHPVLPKVAVRVTPDAAFQTALDETVRAFCWAVGAKREQLREAKAEYDAAREAAAELDPSPI